QEVARSLGSRARQHRRFDFDEAELVQVLARDAADVVANAQVALHDGAPKVEIAIARPYVLGQRRRVVDREGHRLRNVENDQIGNEQPDLTGGHLRVDGFGRAAPQAPAHSDYEFAAQLAGRAVRGRARLRVEDELDDAAVIAQVDEDDAAVIAARIDPA